MKAIHRLRHLGRIAWYGLLAAAGVMSARANPALPQAAQAWPKQLAPLVPPEGSTRLVSRGYMVPKASPAPGGMKITVDSYHSDLGDVMATYLQLALANRGTLETVQLKVLAPERLINPDSYRGRQEFYVTYDELNRRLEEAFPESPQLRIAPGSVLFVLSRWSTGHVWGGTARAGEIVLPEPSDGAYRPTQLAAIERAAGEIVDRAAMTELDIASPIDSTLVNVYNSDGGRRGLKPGGQIRSRVEAEGKYDLSDGEASTAKASLFALVNDPARARALLGTQWRLTLEDRYLKRETRADGTPGALLRGADGLPVPDPMVDTYYDGRELEAARAGAAIRYRWTEGNQTGAWNIKPGSGRSTDGGIVYRIEYGLDTTDDRPESVRAFAASLHPLNVFAGLRAVLPGVNPADLLLPSVKLTDHRYKFVLEHVSNLKIEVSLDQVHAENLRRSGGSGAATTDYFQLEMDIDHLATRSGNGLAKAAAPKNNYGAGLTLEEFKDILSRERGGDPAKSVVRGRPSLHELADLEPDSLLRVRKANDFALAETVIGKLRDHLLPGGWRPAAQKYAYAARRMGLLDRAEKVRERAERFRARRSEVPHDELRRGTP